MTLSIKNAQIEQLATEVAGIAGETEIQAIKRALEDRKKRLLMINRKKVTLSAAEKCDRINKIMEYLEREVWPKIPAEIPGKKMTKREREEILGI